MINLSSFGFVVLFAVIIELAIQELFIKFGKKLLKKNRHYYFFCNASIFSIPIIGFLVLILNQNWPAVELFVLSAFVGTALEYLAGRVLFRLHGAIIWEYQYLPLGKFTSILSFPYWGVPG